nr:hypothetical protein [Tanacetum cinerariifolium]
QGYEAHIEMVCSVSPNDFVVREDLESLWSIVKERFSTSKPNNFTDDYLLTTLGTMFERPDGQAQVWKNQRTVHATITAAPVRVAATYTRRRNGVVIRDLKEESTAKTPAENKSKDKGKCIMVEEPKPMKKKQQVKMDEEYARKLH